MEEVLRIFQDNSRAVGGSAKLSSVRKKALLDINNVLPSKRVITNHPTKRDTFQKPAVDCSKQSFVDHVAAMCESTLSTAAYNPVEEDINCFDCDGSCNGPPEYDIFCLRPQSLLLDESDFNYLKKGILGRFENNEKQPLPEEPPIDFDYDFDSYRPCSPVDFLPIPEALPLELTDDEE